MAEAEMLIADGGIVDPRSGSSARWFFLAIPATCAGMESMSTATDTLMVLVGRENLCEEDTFTLPDRETHDPLPRTVNTGRGKRHL
ncbi:hypothetical protein OG225_43430 (plasmid) [Nocardia sp. NBC_01377]|uniref:hypothetical protein n=1 Tax=Nocardia sp. NBC_01377 TaxID=2903595 RepID=UPI002F9183D7